MRKIITFLLVSVLLFGNSLSYAAIVTVQEQPQWGAQVFIANQIKGIGLVDSYQEDQIDKSYVYDNALAAMASMLMGNFGLAEEIFDTLSFEVARTSQAVPYESYIYSDTNGNGSGLAYSGNCAWLLQALNIYQKLQSSRAYYALQQKLAVFLLALQDPGDGGIRGSVTDYWKSTEHNMMAYVALKNFGRLNRNGSIVAKAEKIRKFLISSAVWDGTRFNRGDFDSTKVVDVQSLGVLLLGSSYASALTWAENNLKLTDSFDPQPVTGFDFNSDLDTVWIEGTLQAALAFYKSGNISKADYYYNEAIKTLQSDGSLFLATSTGTASEFWTLEAWRAIAPTSWLVFYLLRFNPFVIYLR